MRTYTPVPMQCYIHVQCQENDNYCLISVQAY